MSAVTIKAPDAVSDLGPLFRLTVDQYHELADAGIIGNDKSVELLEGIVVLKMTKFPPHVGTVMKLRASIEPVLPPGWRYRVEQPLILGDGEPESDGVIARGSPADDFVAHPTAADVALVIEVADASLARDRGTKLRSYARAGVPFYWIVNLNDRQIELHTDPDPAATPDPTYRDFRTFAANETIAVELAGEVICTLPVASILPPN